MSNKLIDILNHSEAYYHANDIASSRNEMAPFFNTLAENSDSSMEDALKEVNLIGDCLITNKMQSDALIWNPPLGLSDPYNAFGGTLPVKFSVVDLSREFVYSENVRLELFDENGLTVEGPFRFSSNPNKGITITGKQYHHNLNLKQVPAGSYTLMAMVDSPEVGVVAFRRLIIALP
ncbi:MAG: hypothetical protein ACOYYU_02580 [Chloroflexota bacterium]